jgi:hypothetical protein
MIRTRQRPCPRQTHERDDHLRELLGLHFHERYGSRYWLARQERLGLDVLDRVRCLDDLRLLGPTPLDDLRRHSVRDFIPQGFHDRLDEFVIGETAGTSGGPCATAYRGDEFQEAFVAPFLRVARVTGFPREQPWLWVGPSGPHIIGKAVRELARQTGSLDPFSVDFDPRWAKRLAEGSLARLRYLDHVTEQALDVLCREPVGVLFSTPPALAALAQRMSDTQREAIRGVHYGGMSMTVQTLEDFRRAFPRAVHLAGYGNTLFGVVMEVEDGPREALDYFPLGERLHIEVISRPGGDDPAGTPWPAPACERSRRGQVCFHRLDPGCLLVGVVERDEAERIAPSAAARALGATADGLRDPRPPAGLNQRLQLGLY